ncbi:MAG: QueT transporter family protein [Clostridia bacterium]|nr:QueT transporter family protein [Clostridia bacterium]
MNTKTAYLTKAALIAAVYAVLTFVAASAGLAYGEIQFRFSEALTILPLFCPAAVPGLTIGCLVSNITSTINPVDMVVGTLATLFAALCTRALRNVKIKKYPLLSMLMPVIFNGLFIGAEIAYFTGEGTFFKAFVPASLSVAAGEAAVVLILGTILWAVIEKNEKLKSLLK